ncbi:UPF0280 family protein [Salidesulfovibrio onnuriiensis]|uniref:UPF0280 family protein n=1 Tax=Salidesulfovibrio onnuriiensis TaxID=2583823 RepID=UPI0011C9AC91|nr:UPF0280 family protein [Salidesulfovibrio onnuriiensis]
MSKKHLSTERGYREIMHPASGEIGFQVVVEETDLFIIATQDIHEEVAALVQELRGALKNHILFHPEFLSSLEPLSEDKGAPGFIRRMYAAGEACGVGPMAAVAGTIAQEVADRFRSRCPDILVENGGDVYMHSTRERTVALLADPEGGASIGLRVEAEQCPLALCSSSGRIGHSLSLGTGDLVCVLSESGSLADAAATALCNLLGEERDLELVVERAQEWATLGLSGVFAQYGDKLAAWGNLELVALD